MNISLARLSLLITFSLIMLTQAFSQKYLQIETYNDPKTIKIVQGEKIAYKLKTSDDWFDGKIEKLLVEENTIVFENAFVRLEDITHIMRYRPFANYIGSGLMTFGTAWLVFGSIGTLAKGDDFGPAIIIGGGAIAIGWLMRKLFYKRPIEMGKRYRLRLIDLSLN